MQKTSSSDDTASYSPKQKVSRLEVQTAPMRFGCSECLCLTIEGRRSELLHSLLSNPDVVYRDMFWAPFISVFNSNIRLGYCECYPRMQEHTAACFDFSKVGSQNCGHETFDEELREHIICERSDRILVSIPMFARWHSNPLFNAEQMLRDSGKFDYSEPQLYHLFYGEVFSLERDRLKLVKRLLCCEILVNTSHNLSFNFLIGHQMYKAISQVSSSVCNTNRSNELCLKLVTRFGSLSELFELYDMHSYYYYKFCYTSQFLQEISIRLEAGANLNSFLKLERSPSVDYYDNDFEYSTVFSFICILIKNYFYFKHREDFARVAVPFNDLLKFLLRQGLSVFIGTCADVSVLWNNFHARFWPFTRSIVAQLLSLGLGRRELNRLEIVFDQKLEDYLKDNVNLKAVREMDDSLGLIGTMENTFISTPLTLQELSRIAIRRAVGGIDFARRVQSANFASRLPPALFIYVSDPTELMLSAADVQNLLDQMPNDDYFTSGI